jgi:enoyl-CoA hydratase/carnithine racemase
MNDPTMSDLIVEDRNRVRWLTLNRTDALNAFNDALYDAVAAALTDAAEDNAIAAAVITGNGRAFSAGQDLGELADERSHEDRQNVGFGNFIQVLEAFPKPLIAAVNGMGIGIGLTMLPHCDFVLMAESARLKAPFVTLGVCAEAGSSYLLPALLGHGAAAKILFTADWIRAADAVKMGLASQLVADAVLLSEAGVLAEKIAAMPVAALIANKKLLLASRLDAIRAARARETVSFANLLGGPANQEAIAAFMEKRPADFSKL